MKQIIEELIGSLKKREQVAREASKASDTELHKQYCEGKADAYASIITYLESDILPRVSSQSPKG